MGYVQAAREREPEMTTVPGQPASRGPAPPLNYDAVLALNNANIPMAQKARTLFHLQRRHGNRYVQRVLSLARQEQEDTSPAEQTPAGDDPGAVSLDPIAVQGTPQDFQAGGGCDKLRLHGNTVGTFDGGTGNVVNQVVTAAKGCDCPKGVPCLHATGTLVTDYSVSVNIKMPGMPGGLTPCEQGIVQNWLDTVLLPHEQDHKARFMTYNGQTKNPIDITGCGSAGITSKASAIQAAEDTARKAAAKALSASIDPFNSTIDCSFCDADAGKSDAGADAGKDAGKDSGSTGAGASQ